jgi:hypothetical protein
MTKGPLPRSQVISPFGVGAMHVVRDGTSVIAAGLDRWFEQSNGDVIQNASDLEEFKITDETRLAAVLGVDDFRLPPDYRKKPKNADIPNCHLTIPFFRFPRLHVCPDCRYLQEVGEFQQSRPTCDRCNRDGKRRYLIQVPFVAICAYGHIRDLPYREWVHKSLSPACTAGIKLFSTGSTSLFGQILKCDCGAKRSLGPILSAQPDGATELSNRLSPEGQFMCDGQMPWHGSEVRTSCGRSLRGSLRNASNIYYSITRSAIFLPPDVTPEVGKILPILEDEDINHLLNQLSNLEPSLQAAAIRKQFETRLGKFNEPDIATALIAKSNGASNFSSKPARLPDDPVLSFRFEEYLALTEERIDRALSISQVPAEQYDPPCSPGFHSVGLVSRLRETRALVGFDRVLPAGDHSIESRISMLWKQQPDVGRWLPAYKVYGEGLFIRFPEERLAAWEASNAVKSRVRHLIERSELPDGPKRPDHQIVSSRFVLIHTFAHLLMNQLTFDCGYSAASLRERLFVSTDPEFPMAGVLIYTAAGDSEGTLGGLVRMGRPGLLEPVVIRALSNARWCSSDPVCMELGSQGGQGPNSCNLAACHSCALAPETSCEEFNQFLDRALVVGSIENQSLGYFGDLLS